MQGRDAVLLIDTPERAIESLYLWKDRLNRSKSPVFRFCHPSKTLISTYLVEEPTECK